MNDYREPVGFLVAVSFALHALTVAKAGNEVDSFHIDFAYELTRFVADEAST